MARVYPRFPAILAAVALLGCGNPEGRSAPAGVEAGTPGTDGGLPPDPGEPVTTSPGAEEAAELAAAQAALTEAASLDADALLARHRPAFRATLDHDPLAAAGLPLIEQSSFALSTAEREALARDGFVVGARTAFPSFVYGYAAIYAHDLPVFVSADSILYAVHKSYDTILMAVERAALQPALVALLDSMHAALVTGAGATLPETTRADLDVYLAVARGLARGDSVAPRAGGDAELVTRLTEQATRASGAATITLFGVQREEDFSQFTLRGHYTEDPVLQQYFRAMMWLGRVDFRLLETVEGGQIFRRRQLEAALGLRALIDAPALARWAMIDHTIGTFVGEHDSMVVPELDAYLAALGESEASGLARHSDEELARVLREGGFGRQRIASSLMMAGIGEPLPLSRSFLLFGQRYVVDSHVLSNVVFNRAGHGEVLRMMPDPLDAAFAALGNEQAVQLLEPELRRYPYAPDLAAMHALVGQHGEAYWSENLYNLWLGSLRQLSPAVTLARPGLPSTAATEAWGRRLLQTQLASWAELRRDTILYVKQSYTGGVSCEFPDAFVEPNPAFFGAVARFAEAGGALVAGLALDAAQRTRFDEYFTRLASTARRLERMAEAQESGAPHTAEDLAWINQAINVENFCGDTFPFSGWYADLFFEASTSDQLDPVVADVHTQYTDEEGNVVGRVLHVGTGLPRKLVVTVETCTGPRAYVGVASSYLERTTEGFERLDDDRWAAELDRAQPPAWLTPVVVP